jgi:predicted ABC-type ATPase
MRHRSSSVEPPQGPRAGVAEAPLITVLAGVNGAGKSSIQGTMIRESGADYFNPDEAAQEIRTANPGVSVEQANSAAWREGVRLLERAIAERLDWKFETTLAGRTMTMLLERALLAGIEVGIWYVGLDGPDRNVARVRARVAHGGHAIPEETIRARYAASIGNLICLLPSLTSLLVYDNSAEMDPTRGAEPRPVLVLHMERGAVVDHGFPPYRLSVNVNLEKQSGGSSGVASDRQIQPAIYCDDGSRY